MRSHAAHCLRLISCGEFSKRIDLNILLSPFQILSFNFCGKNIFSKVSSDDAFLNLFANFELLQFDVEAKLNAKRRFVRVKLPQLLGRDEQCVLDRNLLQSIMFPHQPNEQLRQIVCAAFDIELKCVLLLFF
jgi:hypothetical protein